MAKYIDIESFFNKHNNVIMICGRSNAEQCFTNFINELMNEPQVDVVEVVRCKDCENFETIASKCYCGEYGGYVTEDDYCSRCVRK